MKSNLKFFKNSKIISLDSFIQNVLYDKKVGYYSSKYPFGKKGDFVTSPKISILFSEMIAIWIVSTWENFGKPKILILLNLGLEMSLMKILLSVLKNFQNSIMQKYFLYETATF